MSASEMTDLNSLVRELSEIHIKLTAYAKQAGKENKPNIARLLRALSFSKEVQALLILHESGLVKDSLSNIENCLQKDDRCNDGEAGSPTRQEDIMKHIRKINTMDQHLYICMKDILVSDKDMNLGDINVCSKCGYTLLGDPPTECIVCRAASGYFRIF